MEAVYDSKRLSVMKYRFYLLPLWLITSELHSPLFAWIQKQITTELRHECVPDKRKPYTDLNSFSTVMFFSVLFFVSCILKRADCKHMLLIRFFVHAISLFRICSACDLFLLFILLSHSLCTRVGESVGWTTIKKITVIEIITHAKRRVAKQFNKSFQSLSVVAAAPFRRNIASDLHFRDSRCFSTSNFHGRWNSNEGMRLNYGFQIEIRDKENENLIRWEDAKISNKNLFSSVISHYQFIGVCRWK